MKQALRALIRADAGVMALATGGVDWKASAENATGPRAVLHLISGAEGHSQEGRNGLFQGRVQIDCFAPSYAEADALARALVAVLDGYRAGDFRGIFRVSERDGREADAARSYRVSLDFMVHHREE